MIHGELEPGGEAADYTQAELDAIEDQGIEIEVDGDEIEFVIPLNVAFFNPDLLPQVGLGPIMRGLGGEAQYKNDEQIDNQLRSVLFQVPRPDAPDLSCLDGPSLPRLLPGRGRSGRHRHPAGPDHGIPRYNDLRRPTAAGQGHLHGHHGRVDRPLPVRSRSTRPTPSTTLDILDFVELRDADGNVIPPAQRGGGRDVTGIRRTTLAAWPGPSTAASRTSTPSPACCRSGTCRGRSSASCSTASGAPSSSACATATGTST